ncbi:MAG: hypothetical protein HUJ76_05685 [Parasporobacterium sp.]|nr:hypothetical protein [Parasporobacterium sp.]
MIMEWTQLTDDTALKATARELKQKTGIRPFTNYIFGIGLDEYADTFLVNYDDTSITLLKKIDDVVKLYYWITDPSSYAFEMPDTLKDCSLVCDIIEEEGRERQNDVIGRLLDLGFEKYKKYYMWTCSEAPGQPEPSAPAAPSGQPESSEQPEPSKQPESYGQPEPSEQPESLKQPESSGQPKQPAPPEQPEPSAPAAQPEPAEQPGTDRNNLKATYSSFREEALAIYDIFDPLGDNLPLKSRFRETCSSMMTLWVNDIPAACIIYEVSGKTATETFIYALPGNEHQGFGKAAQQHFLFDMLHDGEVKKVTAWIEENNTSSIRLHSSCYKRETQYKSVLKFR